MMPRAGAACLGVAGLLWAVGSAQYGDTTEMLWCGALATGMLVLAAGLWLGGRRGIAVGVVGLVAAGAAGVYWVATLAAADLLGVWVLFGAGLAVAAAAGVLAWWLPALASKAAWGMPAGTAFVTVSAVLMLRDDGFAFDLNGWATLLALAGAVLLAARGAAPYQRAWRQPSPAGQ